MFIVLCITAHMTQLHPQPKDLHSSGPLPSIPLHKVKQFSR